MSCLQLKKFPKYMHVFFTAEDLLQKLIMFSLLNMKTRACFFYVLANSSLYQWFLYAHLALFFRAQPEWGIPHAPDFIPLGSWQTGLLIGCWNNTRLLNKGQVTQPPINSSLFSNHSSVTKHPLRTFSGLETVFSRLLWAHSDMEVRQIPQFHLYL